MSDVLRSPTQVRKDSFGDVRHLPIKIMQVSDIVPAFCHPSQKEQLTM